MPTPRTASEIQEISGFMGPSTVKSATNSLIHWGIGSRRSEGKGQWRPGAPSIPWAPRGRTWKPDVLFESHHIGRNRGLPKVGVPLLNICHSGCIGMMPRAFCICVAGFKESEVKSAVDGLMQVPLSKKNRAAGGSLQTAGEKSTIGSAMITIDDSFSICFVNGSLAGKSSSQFSGRSALFFGTSFRPGPG